jgi:hypothetical protein
MAQGEGAAHVPGVKQVLNGDAVRTGRVDQAAKLIVDLLQPCGQRGTVRGANGPANNQAMAPAIGLDAAITGAQGP